jgi:hypothetical protein
MTWRHRGIPYGLSTGNWVRINTVDHRPLGGALPGHNDAVAIVDNETYGSGVGTGIGIYSHTFITLATVEDATGAEVAGLQLLQAGIDGACNVVLLSGRLLSDNGSIDISSCNGSGTKGDIQIRAGETGSGDESGDLTISCQDSHVLGAQGLLTITANQSGYSARDYLHLEGATDFPIPSTLDLSSAGCALSGECFWISGDDTLASAIDAYAGGLTIGATGGVVAINNLATTPGPIAPPANFSGTKTIDGVEVPYY